MISSSIFFEKITFDNLLKISKQGIKINNAPLTKPKNISSDSKLNQIFNSYKNNNHPIKINNSTYYVNKSLLFKGK